MGWGIAREPMGWGGGKCGGGKGGEMIGVAVGWALGRGGEMIGVRLLELGTCSM